MYLKIDGWKNHIHFSAAHLLFNHERCSKLHGHTYALHANIYGSLDSEGFIIDFHQIKMLLRNVAERFDHKLLIPMNNPHVKEKEGEIHIKIDNKYYSFPVQDCLLLPLRQTTVENLIMYILDDVLATIKDSSTISKIELGLDEGFGQGAWAEKKLR